MNDQKIPTPEMNGTGEETGNHHEPVGFTPKSESFNDTTVIKTEIKERKPSSNSDCSHAKSENKNVKPEIKTEPELDDREKELKELLEDQKKAEFNPADVFTTGDSDDEKQRKKLKKEKRRDSLPDGKKSEKKNNKDKKEKKKKVRKPSSEAEDSKKEKRRKKHSDGDISGIFPDAAAVRKISEISGSSGSPARPTTLSPESDLLSPHHSSEFDKEPSENAELDIKELDKSNQSVRERMEQMVKEKSREAKREKSKKNKKRDSLKSTDQLTSDLTQEAVRSLSFDNGEDKTGDEADAKNGDDENEEKEEEQNEELEIALAGLEDDFGGGTGQPVTSKPPPGPSAPAAQEKTAPEKNYKIKVASPTKENHLHKKFKRRYSNPRPVSEPEPITDIIMPSLAPKNDSPSSDRPVKTEPVKTELVDSSDPLQPVSKPISPKKERRASVVKVSPVAMRRNSNPEVSQKQKLPVDAAGPVSAAAIPATRVLQEETQRRLSSISCNSESSLPSRLELGNMVPAATQPVPPGQITETGNTVGTPTRTHIVTGPIGSLATPTIKLPGAGGGTPSTPKVVHQIGGAKTASPQVVSATHQHPTIVTMPRNAPQQAFAQNIIHPNQQQIKLVKLSQSQASPVTIRATPQTVVAHSQPGLGHNVKYIQSPVSTGKHIQSGYLPVQSVITPNAGLITSGPTQKQTLIIRNAQPGAQMQPGQIVTQQQVLVRNPNGNKIMGVLPQGQNSAVHQPVIRQIPAPSQTGQVVLPQAIPQSPAVQQKQTSNAADQNTVVYQQKSSDKSHVTQTRSNEVVTATNPFMPMGLQPVPEQASGSDRLPNSGTTGRYGATTTGVPLIGHSASQSTPMYSQPAYHPQTTGVLGQIPVQSPQARRNNPGDVTRLLERYKILWQGLLCLKNDSATVQLHFVTGNSQMADKSLPRDLTVRPLSAVSLPQLRIGQRMRLEPTQLDQVRSKMFDNTASCTLIALPCGRDEGDVRDQTSALGRKFIEYLKVKQAAGIVNINQSEGENFVLHIFPPCQFVTENLSRLAPDFLQSVQDLPMLMVVITRG